MMVEQTLMMVWVGGVEELVCRRVVHEGTSHGPSGATCTSWLLKQRWAHGEFPANSGAEPAESGGKLAISLFIEVIFL